MPATSAVSGQPVVFEHAGPNKEEMMRYSGAITALLWAALAAGCANQDEHQRVVSELKAIKANQEASAESLRQAQESLKTAHDEAVGLKNDLEKEKKDNQKLSADLQASRTRVTELEMTVSELKGQLDNRGDDALRAANELAKAGDLKGAQQAYLDFAMQRPDSPNAKFAASRAEQIRQAVSSQREVETARNAHEANKTSVEQARQDQAAALWERYDQQMVEYQTKVSIYKIRGGAKPMPPRVPIVPRPSK